MSRCLKNKTFFFLGQKQEAKIFHLLILKKYCDYEIKTMGNTTLLAFKIKLKSKFLLTIKRVVRKIFEIYQQLIFDKVYLYISSSSWFQPSFQGQVRLGRRNKLNFFVLRCRPKIEKIIINVLFIRTSKFFEPFGRSQLFGF